VSTALRLVQPAPLGAGPALAEALRRLADVVEAALAPGAGRAGLLEDAGPEWITPEAAAAIAGLPLDSKAARRRARVRIYSWARGKAWASRPNARTLLIDPVRFRRFLDAHRDKPEVES